ncbi:MAG: PPE family protein, partial [Mycobacterium sp.]
MRMLDFGVWPPEVTSAQMYSGPGSGPMMVAAAAWDTLAAQLASFAQGYSSVLASLEGQHWTGPAANAMAAAAAPYVEWATTTAGQAEQVASQARATTAAFETAHATVVPPALVAANRTQLANLIATNTFGQNAPQIAATEATYAEMWAQDTQAMFGYASSASSATKLSPFKEPPQTANPAGQSAQAAAAAAETAGSGASQSQNWLTELEQYLSTNTTSLFGLPIPDSLMTDLGDINTILGLPNAAGGGLRSVANVVSMTVALFRLWADTILYAPLAGLTSATSPVGALPSGVLAGAAESAAGGVNRAVLASMGSASPVGQMS